MIVATADDAAHEQRLREAGADFVIAPHTLIAEELAFLIAATLTDGAAAAGSRFVRRAAESKRFQPRRREGAKKGQKRILINGFFFVASLRVFDVFAVHSFDASRSAAR